MARGLVLVAAAVLGSLALAVGAAVAQVQWTVSADALGEHGDQHIDYPPYQSATTAAPWMTVNGVGDVNADGLEDIGVGFDGYGQGKVYVTFSDRVGGLSDAVGGNGFEILAGRFWSGISSAGDVNGDGLGDVAVVQTDRVSVVFGKKDAATVDTDQLGPAGFTIEGAGGGTTRGENGIMFNSGVVPLGDINGDGVPDLLVTMSGSNAAIVYPPRTAAGMTIDATRPGPYVSTLTTSGAAQLDTAFVDDLGDLDGDGHDDVLVAGEESAGTDQVAYGVVSPQPGTAIDLRAAVGDGRAFELRTHDGQPGSHGELERAIALGDENGDGRREVGMVGGVDGVHNLRVAFGPSLGQEVDVGDLGAIDSRGYSFHSYGAVLDVGDQSSDGRGDFASYRYVYFTDPAKETGDRQPVSSGFYFNFLGPNFATVAAPIRDLNGDGKPELAVARATMHQNADGSGGQSATYSIDVFDSATAPDVPAPDPPVALPDGVVQVPIDLGTGAGSRGGMSLGIHPVLEVASASGAPVVGSDPGLMASGGDTAHLALDLLAPNALGGQPLVPGHEYRVRYVVGNGRGLSTAGPWRSFVFAPATPSSGPVTQSACRAGGKRITLRGTRRADRLRGTRCRDRLVGLAGNDSIRGGGGDDVLIGGPGRDHIVGGAGRDLLSGGAGDDRLDARDGSGDIVRCGPGRDTVRADRLDRLIGCERRLR